MRHPVLRAIALYLVLSVLFEGVIDEAGDELRSPYGTEAAGLSWLWWGASPTGALLAVLLYRRVGALRLAWLTVLVTQPFALLFALGGTVWETAGQVLGTYVPGMGWTLTAIILLSHRQAVTPDRLLGRTGATLFMIAGLAGILEGPLESLADALAEGVSPLLILVLGTAGALTAAVPLMRVRARAGAEERTAAGRDE
nr:hypothetical protein GCM10020093_041380 [Planobispora longispora]